MKFTSRWIYKDVENDQKSWRKFEEDFNLTYFIEYNWIFCDLNENGNFNLKSYFFAVGEFGDWLTGFNSRFTTIIEQNSRQSPKLVIPPTGKFHSISTGT